MSKKNRPTDSGGNWMDTYGDMVTLLLTFFIMLYSMSNLDAQKWTIFVKSIPSIQNQGSENITINSQMSDTPEVDRDRPGDCSGSSSDRRCKQAVSYDR